jgi:hypothetical protein
MKTKNFKKGLSSLIWAVENKHQRKLKIPKEPKVDKKAIEQFRNITNLYKPL